MENLDIKFGTKKISKEIKKKIVGYILAGFGLVAGLAWNEAIKALIDRFFPQVGGAVWAKLVYAILITVLVVVISLVFVREEKKS